MSSSILLLFEDGEMHPYVQNSNSSNTNANAATNSGAQATASRSQAATVTATRTAAAAAAAATPAAVTAAPAPGKAGSGRQQQAANRAHAAHVQHQHQQQQQQRGQPHQARSSQQQQHQQHQQQQAHHNQQAQQHQHQQQQQQPHPHPQPHQAAGQQQIVLARNQGSGGNMSADAVLTGETGDAAGLGSLVGTHFLTQESGALDGVVTKIEVEQNLATMSVPVEVVVEKGHRAKKSSNPSQGDKKVCLWPGPDGSTCGKSFGKYEGLKKHLQEVHKGHQQHPTTYKVKSNQAASNIQVVQVHPKSKGGSGGSVHIVPQGSTGTTHSNPSLATPLHMPNPLPFLNLNGSLPTSNKPLGSKVCRWVQNDGTVCGKAFSKLDSLRRHVNELHKGVRPYACNMCDKCYGRRDYLDRHIKTHNRKPKSMSGSSLEWGPSGVLLQGDEAPQPPAPKVPKKKRKDIPPEEKKICLWVMEDGTACGKTFTKFDSLKRHVSEAHKGIRPYTCTLCGKSYGRRDYLLRHLKSHNDAEVANLNISKISANPVQQQHIGSSNSGLVTSSINFNSLVPQPPSALGGILTSPTTTSAIGTAGSHHSPQTGIKTAQNAKKRAAEDKKTCKWVLENGTVCGRTFSKFDSLRRHVAELHKGIRPFRCQLCDKTYGRKDYLERHMKSHAEGGLDDETSALNDSLITSMKTDNDASGGMNEEVILSNVVTVVGGEGGQGRGSSGVRV